MGHMRLLFLAVISCWHCHWTEELAHVEAGGVIYIWSPVTWLHSMPAVYRHRRISYNFILKNKEFKTPNWKSNTDLDNENYLNLAIQNYFTSALAGTRTFEKEILYDQAPEESASSNCSVIALTLVLSNALSWCCKSFSIPCIMVAAHSSFQSSGYHDQCCPVLRFQKEPLIPALTFFYVFDGSSGYVLRLILRIFKTFNFTHLHKEFRITWRTWTCLKWDSTLIQVSIQFWKEMDYPARCQRWVQQNLKLPLHRS